MGKDNQQIDLDINSVFEVLSPSSAKEKAFAILGERNSNMTWTQGKKLVISDMMHDGIIILSVDEFLYAIEEWELMNDRKFDGMEVTEQEAFTILIGAIQCKKRRQK